MRSKATGPRALHEGFDVDEKNKSLRFGRVQPLNGDFYTKKINSF